MLDAPLRYDPSYEQPEENEAETAREIVETMRTISETTFKDYGHAVRSVHAKSHGLLQGELRVLDGLPPELAQGLFASPATYEAILRFSTNPGDILDDSVSTPRGLAVKVIGVPGDRLPDADGTTQDFVLVNGPAFVAPTARKFLGSLKLLAKTTDTPQVFKKVLSGALRGIESVVESVSGPSPTLTSLGGQPETQILGDTFYSQVPILYGPYMAKVAVAPVSPELVALTKAPLDANGHPNAIRDSVLAFFTTHGGEWEVRVQLCTDIAAMPIEDASVQWPEDRSPYRAVARLTVGPQPAWSGPRSAAVDDGLSFSPWHALAAHRPLGSIMRVRKPAYEAGTAFRASHNGCPIHEPRAEVTLPV